jgi:hypothetical protein
MRPYPPGSSHNKLTVALLLLAIASVFGVDASRAENQGCVGNMRGDCQDKNNPGAFFEPIVAGKNSCYMAQAYFSRAALESILPVNLTIPDDATMARHYAKTQFDADVHPFMLSFCHGSQIHDVYTNINVPEQEEIMFVFPVIYTHDDGTTHLGSYVPVLYLDSLTGLIGGLYFGLRKEYHPGMKHGVNGAISRWWSIDGIVDASFETQVSEKVEELPQFFEQTFANPFVTISYPFPFSKMVFYQARVHPGIVRSANETFYWRYKDALVKNSDRSSAVYSEYSFTMSKPMNSKEYFNGY